MRVSTLALHEAGVAHSKRPDWLTFNLRPITCSLLSTSDPTFFPYNNRGFMKPRRQRQHKIISIVRVLHISTGKKYFWEINWPARVVCTGLFCFNRGGGGRGGAHREIFFSCAMVKAVARRNRRLIVPAGWVGGGRLYPIPCIPLMGRLSLLKLIHSARVLRPRCYDIWRIRHEKLMVER